MSKLEAVTVAARVADDLVDLGAKLVQESGLSARVGGLVGRNVAPAEDSALISARSVASATDEVLRQPRRGEQLYVSSRGSDMSPMFDREGGLATVRDWTMETSAGTKVPFVTFDEFPGSLNFKILLEDQGRLSKQYEGRVARHTPDFESIDDGFRRGF